MNGRSEMDFLKSIDIHDIARLDVFTEYYNSILIYTQKVDGAKYFYIPSMNIKSTKPIGYQLPVEFYSPKYDTQASRNNSTPDLRTTIYWKPDVITDDEGNAKLDFYTADNPGTYSVIVEGVSDEGKLIHYFGKSSITVK
jgi:hypothetical protein